MRHGLTAATVVPAIEDAEEFERFAAAIRADYQPVSTIEHELVARLTSLLWRLRRATLIETNLFQLQGRLAMEQKLGTRTGSDTASPGMGMLYRLLRSPNSFVPSQADFKHAHTSKIRQPTVANARTRTPLAIPIQRQSSCGCAISTASRSSGSIGTRRRCGDKWLKRCSFLMHARSVDLPTACGLFNRPIYWVRLEISHGTTGQRNEENCPDYRPIASSQLKLARFDRTW